MRSLKKRCLGESTHPVISVVHKGKSTAARCAGKAVTKCPSKSLNEMYTFIRHVRVEGGFFGEPGIPTVPDRQFFVEPQLCSHAHTRSDKLELSDFVNHRSMYER
jgi:hypothetical protein